MNEIEMTKEDKNVLLYACRVPFAVGIMITLLGISIGFVLRLDSVLSESTEISDTLFKIAPILGFLIGAGFALKHIRAFRNGMKTYEIKKIDKKEEKKNFEAGESRNYSQNYSWIIDGVRYRVEEEQYRASKTGDEVVFFYSAIGKYRLSMDLRKNTKV